MPQLDISVGVVTNRFPDILRTETTLKLTRYDRRMAISGYLFAFSGETHEYRYAGKTDFTSPFLVLAVPNHVCNEC